MEAQKIGTEIVRTKFGEVKPEVIYQDEEKRVTLARAVDGAVGAYSIVHFDKFGKGFMPEVHREITKGKFMGETFQEYNIPVHREEKCTFVYRLPLELQELFNRPEKESFCKAVTFRIGHVRVPYASITEVYSPAIGFDSLFENDCSSIKETVKELDSAFPTEESYFITFLNPGNIERYLNLAHEFLKKPIHVGIENREEFVRQTLETGIDLLKDPNTILLVAQKEDDYVGYLAANIHPALHVNGLECMISELYVKENFRKRGISSSLVRTIERLVFERGAKRVSLATNMDDDVQNSFYASLGYERRCDFDVKYLKV